MPDTEAELLEKVRAGDRVALEALLAGYYDRLVADLGKQIAKTKFHQRVSAEDVVQEAYTKAYSSASLEKLLDGQQAHNFYGWIRTIAVNAFRDMVSRPQPPPHSLSNPHETGVDPSQQVVDRARDPMAAEAPTLELPSLMLAALESLSDEHRQAIEMVYFEGLGPHEAAQRLEMEYTTFNGRLFRAKEKLRAHLQRLSLYI